MVALFIWGNVVEDYLDHIGLSLDDFCERATGGWLFGYVEALQAVGIDPVIFCHSIRLTAPERRVHRPTGCRMTLLPAPRAYWRLAPLMTDPYATSARAAFGLKKWNPLRVLARPAFELAPYLATSMRQVEAALREDGCRGIVAQEYEDARFDMLVSIGERLEIPVIATFQGGDRRVRRLERLLRPRTLRRCRGLAVASRAERERLGGVGCPVVDIPNPIDADVWRPLDRASARAELSWSPDERIAIWHGRVAIDRKGLDVLVEAWRSIDRGRIAAPARLVLVGDGRDGDALGRILAANPDPSVTWLRGYSLDRPLLRLRLSAADVAVSSSRHEGFPVAPIEAMACGLPLVATDANGNTDILADGAASGGQLVPRNDAAALARALTGMLEDRDLSRQLGERARAGVVARYGMEPVGRKLAQLIGLGDADHDRQ